jgi:glycosyltransferase involved in cell wall biosynthesis
VAQAFNLGISLAKGNYIARMDADDEMLPRRIELQKMYLDEHAEVGVVSSLIEHGGDRSRQEGYAVHIDWLNSLLSHDDIFLNRFVDSPVCNPSVMFRKELADKFGGAEQGDFPEDYEMWLRWMENGVRFGKVDHVLLKWNDPETRATRNDDRYSPEAFNRVKTEYLIRELGKKLHGRKLLLCGAGRITRKKSEELGKNVRIDGFIDVDPAKIGKLFDGRPVIGLDELASPYETFVLSYVGNRGAREEIRRILKKKGFVEGDDFIMAS